MNDISAVFNDEVVEDVAEEATEEVTEAANESEKVEEAPEVESKDEPKEPEKAETTSEEEAEKESWTFQAVKDERRKRQAEKEKNRDLERQLAELKAGQNQPEKPELPDVFENQEEFAKSLEERLTANSRQQIIQTQRDMMIEFKSDYEEKEAAFIEFGKDNPALLAQANASPNPAKFAYEQGSKYLKFQQMQDVDSLEAKMRAEIEAKVRSEFESKQKTVEDKASRLSPSLANARGAVEADESVPENPGDLF